MLLVIGTSLLMIIDFHFSMSFSLKKDVKTPMYETNEDPSKQSPAMLTLSDLSFITSSFHLALLLASNPMNFSAVANFSISSACSFSTLSLFAFVSSNSACAFLWAPDTSSNLFSKVSFFSFASLEVSAAFCDLSRRGCTIRYFSLNIQTLWKYETIPLTAPEIFAISFRSV